MKQPNLEIDIFALAKNLPICVVEERIVLSH